MPKVPSRRRVRSSCSQSSQGSDSSSSSSFKRATYTRHNKPPYSYVGLISMVIMISGGQATLAEINAKLKSWFEFFNDSYTGWKDSIRHMLSNNPCFQKVLRCPNKPNGKGNMWTVDVSRVDKSFLTIQQTGVARSGEFPRFLHEHLGYPSIWELAKMGTDQRITVSEPKEEVHSPQTTPPQDQTMVVPSVSDEQTTNTEQTTIVFPESDQQTNFVTTSAEQTIIVPAESDQQTTESDQQTTLAPDDVTDDIFIDQREKYTSMACLNLNILADDAAAVQLEHHQEEEQSGTYQQATCGVQVVHTQEEPHRYAELLAAMPIHSGKMSPLDILVYAALFDHGDV